VSVFVKGKSLSDFNMFQESTFDQFPNVPKHHDI